MKKLPFRRSESLRSWPLYLLAAPAAVAVWSGWVGIGEKTGFGPVRPLPGILNDFTINTAITLPIGVESYAAFALGAWLTRKPLSDGTRKFACISAIGALVLGGLGQIAYHLLEVAGYQTAPWQITTIVACFPVSVLGMGATLAHMIHRDARTEPNMILVPAEQVPQVHAEVPLQVPNRPTICTRSIQAHPNLNQRLRNQRPNQPEPARQREPEPPNQQANDRTSGTRTEPNRTSTPNLDDRAKTKAKEVRKVRNLIDKNGYEEVSLTTVQNLFPHLSKTTAYQRLTAARTEWNLNQPEEATG